MSFFLLIKKLQTSHMKCLSKVQTIVGGRIRLEPRTPISQSSILSTEPHCPYLIAPKFEFINTIVLSLESKHLRSPWNEIINIVGIRQHDRFGSILGVISGALKSPGPQPAPSPSYQAFAPASKWGSAGGKKEGKGITKMAQLIHAHAPSIPVFEPT